MTPSQLEALQSHAVPGVVAAEQKQLRRRLGVLPGDIISLTDVWVLLAVLWGSRIATSNLDPAVALFGLITFALVLSPARRERGRLSVGALHDAGPLLRRVGLAYAAATAVSVAVGIGDLRVLLFVAVVAGPLLVAGRGASYGIAHSLRKAAKSRTLIVGGGVVAKRIIETLSTHDEYGLEVVGAVDDDPKYGNDELGAPTIGRLADVPNLVRERSIEVVLVAFSATDHGSMVDLIRSTMSAGATVWVVPRFFELGAADSNGDHVWGLPVMRLQAPARSRPEWVMKRALDFIMAGIGVLLLSPILAVIAALVYLEAGRPILLKQTRVGLDGKPFGILKFRTMRSAPEPVEETEWSADGQRMTRIGRLLRKTSVDELPQLFNVLKGEMSLVGPRPERPYFVHLFSDLYPSYNSRHRLPAGITGWAQVHGLRGDTSIEERAAFDNYYIENWSLSSDLKILFKTAFAMFTREEEKKVQQSKGITEDDMEGSWSRG
jgi:exopolysaccharide biosynthesis polyprenyl glycosylphosphotransferase